MAADGGGTTSARALAARLLALLAPEHRDEGRSALRALISQYEAGTTSRMIAVTSFGRIGRDCFLEVLPELREIISSRSSSVPQRIGVYSLMMDETSVERVEALTALRAIMESPSPSVDRCLAAWELSNSSVDRRRAVSVLREIAARPDDSACLPAAAVLSCFSMALNAEAEQIVQAISTAPDCPAARRAEAAATLACYRNHGRA
jgi:hypothetical protein